MKKRRSSPPLRTFSGKSAMAEIEQKDEKEVEIPIHYQCSRKDIVVFPT